ncbi:Integral membrane protein OS=Streptomyces glaucescens OX=1907 GN=SGLAU_15305 PE=4 SV=1 [Streptomyces glaucescens]
MGIESDKVVYEYLSRVGDVAQQRQLPSAARMRLVSQLRDEIDRRRAKAPVDSPAAVRRIIDRLGSPDDVVTAAGDSGARTAPEPPRAAVPVQREEKAGKAAARERRPKNLPKSPPKNPPESPAEQTRGLPRSLRRVVPRPRPAAPERPADDAPAPPHLASLDELGGSAGGRTGGGWTAPRSARGRRCRGSSAAWRSRSC